MTHNEKVIGASVGGLALLIILYVLYERLRKKQGTDLSLFGGKGLPITGTGKGVAGAHTFGIESLSGGNVQHIYATVNSDQDIADGLAVLVNNLTSPDKQGAYIEGVAAICIVSGSVPNLTFTPISGIADFRARALTIYSSLFNEFYHSGLQILTQVSNPPTVSQYTGTFNSLKSNLNANISTGAQIAGVPHSRANIFAGLLNTFGFNSGPTSAEQLYGYTAFAESAVFYFQACMGAKLNEIEQGFFDAFDKAVDKAPDPGARIRATQLTPAEWDDLLQHTALELDRTSRGEDDRHNVNYWYLMNLQYPSNSGFNDALYAFQCGLLYTGYAVDNYLANNTTPAYRVTAPVPSTGNVTLDLLDKLKRYSLFLNTDAQIAAALPGIISAVDAKSKAENAQAIATAVKIFIMFL